MSNIGIFFALTAIKAAEFQALPDQNRQQNYVYDTFYSAPASEIQSVNVDVAWDAIHRCLGDGSLNEDPAAYPMRLAVLGGVVLNTQPNFIMRLKSPEQVKSIAIGLSQITQDDFHTCYFAIPALDYGMQPNQSDFDYSWQYFKLMRSFYGQAATEGKYVLFTADQ